MHIDNLLYHVYESVREVERMIPEQTSVISNNVHQSTNTNMTATNASSAVDGLEHSSGTGPPPPSTNSDQDQDDCHCINKPVDDAEFAKYNSLLLLLLFL